MCALGLLLAGALAACSAPEEAGAPAATPDEERALAEARAMIPASELPGESGAPPATPSAKP